MNLRCKPGDRALVWRNTIPLQCHCTAIGHVVTVTNALPLGALDRKGVSHDLGIAWRYAGEPILCEHGGPIYILLDADLVPLPPENDVRAIDAAADLHGERSVPVSVDSV